MTPESTDCPVGQPFRPNMYPTQKFSTEPESMSRVLSARLFQYECELFTYCAIGKREHIPNRGDARRWTAAAAAAVALRGGGAVQYTKMPVDPISEFQFTVA